MNYRVITSVFLFLSIHGSVLAGSDAIFTSILRCVGHYRSPAGTVLSQNAADLTELDQVKAALGVPPELQQGSPAEAIKSLKEFWAYRAIQYLAQSAGSVQEKATAFEQLGAEIARRVVVLNRQVDSDESTAEWFQYRFNQSDGTVMFLGVIGDYIIIELDGSITRGTIAMDFIKMRADEWQPPTRAEEPELYAKGKPYKVDPNFDHPRFGKGPLSK